MAQTHFFMNRKDTLDLISFLIDLASAEFIPESSPDPPPFPRYVTVAEIEERMDRDPYYSRFLVLSREWERFPLVIDEIHANDGRHFYSASTRYGGPTFDLIVSRTFGKKNERWMIPGSFSDYAYYIQDAAFINDHSLYCTFDRPASMASVHKEVQKYVRRNGCRSICRETGHTGPWILSSALKEYESDMWLRMGDFHYVPKPKVSKSRQVKRST